MIQLKLGNSYSKISGLSARQLEALRALMSYDLDSNQAFFGNYKSTKRYLLSKRGDYPTGLHYIIKRFLTKHGLHHKIYDTRIKPNAITAHKTWLVEGTYPIPREAQIEAVKSAVMKRMGIISAVTGSGKSLMIAMTIDRIRVPTLVVVPSLAIKRQLQENFDRWFHPDVHKHIVVKNVDSLDPDYLCDFGMVIVDELHHVAAQTYRKANKKSWVNIYYRFGFTATAYRSNDNERLLFESFLSRVIYRLSYHDAVSAKYIVPVEAYYISLPKVKVKSESYPEVYSELVVGRKDRNEIIAILLRCLNSQQISTLCLIRDVEHGKKIQDLCGAAFAHGNDPEHEDLIGWFSDKKINTLVGTTSLLGEGCDTRAAEYIVIAGLGKSKIQFRQQIGRGLRLYPGKESCKVILFYDPSHKFTRKHFREQCTILKEEYGIVPVKLDL